MTSSELRRLRKNIQPSLDNFGKIYGCYVNAAKEIIAKMEIPVLDMDAEEREMYSKILKKPLSGTEERNLFTLSFPTEQVAAGSDEHKLLMAARASHLEDEGMRDLLYSRIIENLEMDGKGYVIVLAADVYDIRTGRDDNEEWSEESVSQFDYFICSICPVKESKAALRYLTDTQAFRGVSTGSVLAAPLLGFMFPTIDEGQANIYEALYYSRSSAEIHEELINGLFRPESVPMSADSQKESFNMALSDALGSECSLDIVTSLQARLSAVVEESKELSLPGAPEVAVDEIGSMLTEKGVSEEGVRAFRETVEKSFDGAGYLNAGNLIEKKAFKVSTAEAQLTVDPEQACELKTKTIDGRTYLLVPVGEGVRVNGIDVSIEYGE